MIVIAQVMVDDGVVGVICLEEVLEGSRALLRRRFDVVDFDRGQINVQVVASGL